MKKLIVLAAMLAALGSAQAVEIGINGTSGNYTTQPILGYGLTVGQQFCNASVTASVTLDNKSNVNKYGVVGAYDVVTYKTITFYVEGGASYLINDSIGVESRIVGLAGIGASVPINKNLSVYSEYTYQHGNSNANLYNGSSLITGVKYSF